MRYLLDTNICSTAIKQPGRLAHRFFQHSGALAISTVILAELFTWVYRRSDPEPLLTRLEQDLLADLVVMDFDSATARQFGQLRASLMSAGINVTPADLMIASVALNHDLTLVTHNVRHFEVIPGLRIEDWLAS